MTWTGLGPPAGRSLRQAQEKRDITDRAAEGVKGALWRGQHDEELGAAICVDHDRRLLDAVIAARRVSGRRRRTVTRRRRRTPDGNATIPSRSSRSMDALIDRLGRPELPPWRKDRPETTDGGDPVPFP
jgi:hypothetical protein